MDHVIPSGVVDIEAYHSYKNLEASDFLLEENNSVFTSLGSEVHYSWPKPLIASKTRLLPFEERKGILEHSNLYNDFLLWTNSLRRRAYGENEKGEKNLSKFSDDSWKHETEIMQMLAEHRSFRSISKMLNKRYGSKVKVSSIKKIAESNAIQISQKQETWRNSYAELRLFHKRGRLEELERLYQSKFEDWELSRSKNDYLALVKTLEAIKKEVDEQEIIINQNLQLNVDVEIGGHTQTLLAQETNIGSIILMKIAAKNNLDFGKLVKNLLTSPYATGIDQRDNSQAHYPSNYTYDLTALKGLVAENELNDLEDKSYVEFQEVKVETPKEKDVRSKLKRIVEQYRNS